MTAAIAAQVQDQAVDAFFLEFVDPLFRDALVGLERPDPVLSIGAGFLVATAGSFLFVQARRPKIEAK